MNRTLEIKGSLLARNTLFNLIGQGLPLIVAVVTIPFIIHGLGIDRFGLLSLAWVVLGYFAIFDLGLGRATTKFVAEALGKGEEDQVPPLVWTAVTIQAFFGLLGAIVLASITPFLVERILNIPTELIKEAKATFYLLSLSIPVVLVSSSFRGVLEASQRFDLVNIVRVPASVLTFLLPLIGLLLGFSLPGIVALILLARVGALAAFVVMNLRINPQLRRYLGSFALFPRLFSFGGWITVTSIVGPILVYLERFLIASLMSMAAVAYYSAPYEAVTRLWIIPASLAMTLFPAFSSLEGVRDRQKLGTLFARSAKYILLVLGPIVLIIGLMGVCT
jgi:O-antigen/teichoic acid export membrane protein